MKVIDLLNENEDMEFCAPYSTADEKIWVVRCYGSYPSPSFISIKDGEETIDNATPEQLKAYAKKLNADYPLYRGYDDEHILLDALEKRGCVDCPFRDYCEAVNKEIEEEEK